MCDVISGDRWGRTNAAAGVLVKVTPPLTRPRTHTEQLAPQWAAKKNEQ